MEEHVDLLIMVAINAMWPVWSFYLVVQVALPRIAHVEVLLYEKHTLIT